MPFAKDEFDSLMLQNETSKGRGGIRYLPYAFKEQGVAMLYQLYLYFSPN
ncbi:MAG TPA: ORF6N domain-containing protein [Bacteroidia bacterium]|nr:ORF6N domain-containing protein [Bacteroidia bacterium]